MTDSWHRKPKRTMIAITGGKGSPSTLRRKRPRLETRIRQAAPNSLPLGRAIVESKNKDFGAGPCLVSKFASTWTSHGGKPWQSNRYPYPDIFKRRPSETRSRDLKWATSKLARRAKESIRVDEDHISHEHLPNIKKKCD